MIWMFFYRSTKFIILLNSLLWLLERSVTAGNYDVHGNKALTWYMLKQWLFYKNQHGSNVGKSRCHPHGLIVFPYCSKWTVTHFTGTPKLQFSQRGATHNLYISLHTGVLFNLISCCLLSVILLLPKIFYTTLYSLTYHQMQGSIFEKHLNSFITFYSSSKAHNIYLWDL